MKLLFVHEVNWRTKVIYEIHDLPELLSLRGHEVVFIDYPEGAARSGLRRFLDFRTEIYPAQRRAHKGAHVEVRTPGRVLPPPADRLFASLTQVPELVRNLRRGGFDAVVLYGVPTNGWQTVWLARRLGVPVLFRAIDISHELRTTSYGWLVRRAEAYIYRNADGISTHNAALRDYCVANGADLTTISIDYPGIDLQRFFPGPRDPVLATRYGVRPEHRVLLFMGTFFRFSGLDWFLEELGPRLRADPTLRLILVGGGEAEASLRHTIELLGVSGQVVLTGFIDYSQLAEHLRLADVAISTFPKLPVTDCALPGKVLQYLACGVPVVCTPLTGLKAMIPEGEGILYREQGAPFVDTVLTTLEHPSAGRVLAGRAREAVEKRCQWDQAIDRFERAIAAAVRRGRQLTESSPPRASLRRRPEGRLGSQPKPGDQSGVA